MRSDDGSHGGVGHPQDAGTDADERLGDYLDAGVGPAPDGAVRVRALLTAESTWQDPPPATLDGILGAIRADRDTGAGPATAPRSIGTAPLPHGGTSAGGMDEVSLPPPQVVPLRRPRRPGRRLLLVAAAVVLFVAGGVAGWIAGGDGWFGNDAVVSPASTPARLAGTKLAPKASASARIRDTRNGVAITLRITGLPPSAPGMFYEAWLRSPSGDLVAIGTFHLRGGGDDPVELWSGVDVKRYPTLTVTLQREGAGPQSSGRVLLRGSIPD